MNTAQELRELAYLTLVRSQLENAWDQYKIKYISNLAKVQRKAERFVKQDYSKYNLECNKNDTGIRLEKTRKDV